jgi:hypothetical protein
VPFQNKPGKQGFFLMVEGGKIDHAHHGSEVRREDSSFLSWTTEDGACLTRLISDQR